MSEFWKPVLDWEGLYEVSNLGNVRSLPRQTRRGMRGGNAIGHYVRKHDGYPEVMLCAGERKQKRFVHHLVLETFIDRCPEGEEALHGPGGKLDASLTNLKWGTRAKNVGEDRVRDHQSNRGEHHGLTPLTWADVCEIRRRHTAGTPQNQLAREYPVCVQTINNIVNFHTWKYPPSEW